MQIANKVFIVTGGASGLGEGTARMLAKEGATVVIAEFKEEKGRDVDRMMRIAATIVVERDGHKAMVIGEKGERLKRISTDARQELEKLLDAKVFLEVWVKVRSGWADDEARVRSFGYE